VERDSYICTALAEHLHTDTYHRLSKPAATDHHITDIRDLLEHFLSTFKKSLNTHDYTFLHRSMTGVDPYLYFYQTYKIHKNPKMMRPIISVCGSLLHGLGQWLNKHLQPIAAAQLSYISNSAHLLACFKTRGPWFTPGTHFFTADAVSMYTKNIDDTDHGLTAAAYV
jgi:hypothetical protein